MTMPQPEDRSRGLTRSGVPSEDQQRHGWLMWLLLWDGVLPVLVIACPWLLAVFLPGQEALRALIALLMVPVVAAFLRADAGYRRLCVIMGGNPGIARQILLAGAIVMLLLLDGAVAALRLAKDEPPWVWLVPLGFYLVYLVLVALALRPVATDDHKLWPGYGAGFDDEG